LLIIFKVIIITLQKEAEDDIRLNN